jgi:hypothetical protein
MRTVCCGSLEPFAAKSPSTAWPPATAAGPSVSRPSQIRLRPSSSTTRKLRCTSTSPTRSAPVTPPGAKLLSGISKCAAKRPPAIPKLASVVNSAAIPIQSRRLARSSAPIRATTHASTFSACGSMRAIVLERAARHKRALPYRCSVRFQETRRGSGSSTSSETPQLAR